MIVHVFATFLLDQGSKQLHRVPVEYKLHQQVEEVKAHFMDPVNKIGIQCSLSNENIRQVPAFASRLCIYLLLCLHFESEKHITCLAL